MTVHRILAAAAVTAAVPLLLAAAAGPAQAAAHGAPLDPVSRAVACSPDGGARAQTAACRAARAVTGGDLAAWDNLRVPDVAGRDREVIPDGRLCSAGLAGYRGFDLPRADWPATRLRPGQELTVSYRGTIAHRGTFRLYLTRDGYDPQRPLRWSDLDAEPFLTVTDPPLVGGSYRFTGGLPADRSGRHLIYTVWANSDTSDTYYSCSDVDLVARRPAGQPAAAAAATRSAAAVAAVPAAGQVRAAPAAATAPLAATAPEPEPTSPGLDPEQLRAVTEGQPGVAPYVAGGIAVLSAAAAGVLHLRRRRADADPDAAGATDGAAAPGPPAGDGPGRSGD